VSVCRRDSSASCLQVMGLVGEWIGDWIWKLSRMHIEGSWDWIIGRSGNIKGSWNMIRDFLKNQLINLSIVAEFANI
jgi:hypothetical protein